MLLTTGPVDRDFVLGDLTNWHLEVLNNTREEANIRFTIYALYPLFPHPIPIGTTSVDLSPGEYTFLTLEIEPKYEHTLPIIDLPEGDILLTLYGRNANDKAISGAIYAKVSLVELSKPFCDMEEGWKE